MEAALKSTTPVDKLIVTWREKSISLDLSLRLEDWNDEHFESIGKLLVSTLRRERNAAICERDGHDWSSPILHGKEFPILCHRCRLYQSGEPVV